MTASSHAAAQVALSRALASSGAERIEGLVKLSRREPTFGPVWAALAEEHWNSRRREDALSAARRALRIDPSLHGGFSSELAQASRPILAKLAEQNPARNEAESSRPAATSPSGRQEAGESPDQALAQAKILVGYARRDRMVEIARRHPGHAPTWLALAEENLVQYRTNEALEAAEQALHLDPQLESQMSSDLHGAWSYSQRPSYSGPQQPGAAPPQAEAPAPQPAVAPIPQPAASPSPPGLPRLDGMLAATLAIGDRDQRLAVLCELAVLAPNDVEVTFHMAKELALANRAEEARRAGETLQKLSMERYHALYIWAEEHWSKKSQDSPLTQVLNLLDIESASIAQVPDTDVAMASLPESDFDGLEQEEEHTLKIDKGALHEDDSNFESETTTPRFYESKTVPESAPARPARPSVVNRHVIRRETLGMDRRNRGSQPPAPTPHKPDFSE